MKYKLIDGSSFILAGVTKYGSKTNSRHEHDHSHRPDPTKIRFDFDLPSFTFDIDKEALKREALKAKEEAMKFKEAALKATDEFVKTYKQTYENNETSKEAEYNSDMTSDNSESAANESESANAASTDNASAESTSTDNTSAESTSTNSTTAEGTSADSESSEGTSTENTDSHNTEAKKNTAEYDDFSKYFDEFGKQMNAFGSVMGEYGKQFGKSMKSWSKNFEKAFSKEWAEGMENTIKDIFNVETKGSHQPHHPHHPQNPFSPEFAKEFNRHWSGSFSNDDYAVWELTALFNELYERESALKQSDLTPDIYYEVLCSDLGTPLNDELRFVGCQVKSTKELPYSVVSQRLTAQQWLVIKLNDDEFKKDWMKQVEKLEILSNFTIEPYFILRHFKSKEKESEASHKIYIPLKEVR